MKKILIKILRIVMLLYLSITASLLVFAKAQDLDITTCGLFCQTKAATPLGLRSCLKTELEFDPSVIVDDILNVPKLVFPSDGDLYDLAREAFKGDMFPVAIVYAQSKEDVKRALDCSFQNGHSVSPRGGNHNQQGLGSMHGHVVIDLRLTCSPDDFVIDRTTLAGSKHIFDQNVIGTMKLQAGCPMGVVNSAMDKYFAPSEGAMTVYSYCPSISIGGFLIGGGSGDQTPYLGWGVDVIHEIDVILYDGTEVTASEEQNSDLFWALRGGGAGFGIVTDVTMKIVESPPPRDTSQERKFLHVTVQYDVGDSEKATKFAAALQYFMYDYDPAISTKFGGMAFQGAPYHFLVGQYLGSWQEFVEDWAAAGLFYEDFASPDTFDSSLTQNYEAQAIHSLPSKGVVVREYDSYPELWAMRVCDAGLLGGGTGDFSTRRTFNFCADLGIDDEFCKEVEGVTFGNAPSPFTLSNPDCNKKEVIETLVKNAYDVDNVINRSGLHPQYVEDVIATPGNEDIDIVDLRLSLKDSAYHGALLPQLEAETLADIFTNNGFYFATHFQHGAPIKFPKDSTAFAQRATGIMLLLPMKEHRDYVFTKLLEDAAYGGDASKLQGYINYMGPKGNPDWRKFYFGDNYEKLQEVKASYDPMDVFGKPSSVELPEPSYKKSKKPKKNKKSKNKKPKKPKKNKN